VIERTQRVLGAAKKLPVPEGTYAVGVGLIILGITAYGFQVLAAKRLSDADYSGLNILWALVFVLTPGLFQPLEQEVGRALSHRRALGIGGGPLVKRAAHLGGILAVIVVAGALIAYRPIVDELFNGRGGLMIGLIVAILCYFVAFIVRGTLSGNGRFGSYGVLGGAEGSARMILCIALFVLAVTSPGWWGFALAIPPIIAVGIALRGQHDLITPGPDAPYSELSTALGLLLVGSIFAQLLSYISVLGVQLLATPEQRKTLTAGFITAVFIARIPLLMFQAIQAALLPKLARQAGEGKHADFRAGIMRLVAIVVSLCIVGTLVATVIGPELGKKLFPTKWHDLGSRDMFLLTLGLTLFIVALTLAQGLIALKRYRQNAIAWVAGVVAFVITVTIAGDDLFFRNEIALVVGAVVAVLCVGSFLFLAMRRHHGDLEDLVEVIEHESLEI
jgi:O-antigen/teichoic acid export membrane protein